MTQQPDRKLMQQALDALDRADKISGYANNIQVRKALRERLAQPEQEPVGEVGTVPGTRAFTMACFKADDVPVGTKLYRHPQPEQEPVAWNWMQDGIPCSPACYGKPPDADIEELAARNGKTVRMLYTAPQPAQQPLQLNWEPLHEFWRNHSSSIDWDELEAAVTEAAHGINDRPIPATNSPSNTQDHHGKDF